MPLYECLRPVTRLWYSRVLGAGPLSPKPMDAPVIRSGVPGAERLLLLGNGPASGWGTVTFQLALVGHLARAMTTRTGDPWDADFVGEEMMNLASARAWLGDRELSPYRAIVLVIGVNDALRLTPVQNWERDLTALLAYLSAGAPAGAPILVSGIPQPSRSSSFVAPFGGVADRHAVLLNAATQQLVADLPTVSYVHLTPPAGHPVDSPGAYQSLAAVIGAELETAVTEQRLVGAPLPTPLEAEREWEWDVAPQIVELARHGGSATLQRIADEAKARFGVQMATVSILDGDRLYYTVNTDRLPNSVPRSLSHCKVVVEEDAPLVVPNSNRDVRFRNNPLIDVSHALFYAGFPLHASDGRTVGALCLLDGFPKDERTVPIADLKHFALQAQDELQRMELEARRQVQPEPVTAG